MLYLFGIFPMELVAQWIWTGLSLRGIARSEATQQSEAIPTGIASIILPAYGLEIIHQKVDEEV